MLANLTLLIFPALMAFAAASDLLTMRISNPLVLAVVVAFLALAVPTGLPLDQLGWHLGAGLLVLAVAFGFFAAGWIGGGDAKLAAAIALWMGWDGLLVFLVYSALLGGALTLAILLVRRFALPGFALGWSWATRLHDAQTGVPYGIALATAAVLNYPDTSLYARLLGL